MLKGILAAVALSILMFFQRSWWPHGEVLGQVPRTDEWHSIRSNPRAKPRPDVVVFRWEAPLFFANAGMFRQQLLHQVRRHQPRWVVLQCEAITDIDVSAADVLERLDLELDQVGIHIAFVELRTRLHERLERYGLLGGTLDRDHFYPTIDEALAAIDAADAGPKDP